mgnify:CR=1 FL=1
MESKKFRNKKRNYPGMRNITIRGKGLKHDNRKPMWNLLPWVEMEEVVRVLTWGAKKYSPNSWKLVKEGEGRYFSACLRHLAAIGQKRYSDPETGLNHYSHAVCSLLFAFYHHRRNNGQAKRDRNSRE